MQCKILLASFNFDVTGKKYVKSGEYVPFERLIMQNCLISWQPIAWGQGVINGVGKDLEAAGNCTSIPQLPPIANDDEDVSKETYSDENEDE